ncbi:18447_t:CDS:2 [Dentiscutata erythropus]|uniref:18447_t:CDS:1 n=1 Tax=Dentiscutata erythropus TaxID=1348616 RepID=A0A9N8YYI3_9GLOM|nr:18447_t:CDS:2 [Dentiscutata erythropus]
MLLVLTVCINVNGDIETLSNLITPLGDGVSYINTIIPTGVSSMLVVQEAEHQLKLGISGMVASFAVGNVDQSL